MLNQLIEELEQVPSVIDKITSVHEKAKQAPGTPADLIELVRLTKYRNDEKDFPLVNHVMVDKEIQSCKQVLVEKNFYYI
jgi:hypothetical protein